MERFKMPLKTYIKGYNFYAFGLHPFALSYGEKSTTTSYIYKCEFDTVLSQGS